MSMKIAGNSRTRTAATRKTAARSSGGEAFSVSSGAATGPAQTGAPVSTTSTITAVDALLAVQEVPNERENARRVVKRGNDMLDLLEDIRLGLLTGSVPRARLEQLLHMVDDSKERFVDPRLAQVLDEIELRARVELAKFEQALK